MKKFFSTVLMVCILFVNLSVPAVAADVSASNQIAGHASNVAATGNGEIAVMFSISGTSKMDEIGANKIRIYAQSGSMWVLVKTFWASNDGMSSTDTNFFSNTIYYSGTAGIYYKIEITVFAKNAAGSDSRTDIRYVTAKQASAASIDFNFVYFGTGKG